MHKHMVLGSIIAAILVLNVSLATISWLSLSHDRQLYREHAVLSAQSFTQILEQNISGMIDTIDMGIFDLAREVERQLAGGGVDRKALGGYMVQAQKHLPELEGLRVADAAGDVFYPGQTPAATRLNITDRDYFSALRDNPGSGLVISRPMKGKIATKWIVVLARRINRPDGSFGGVALGALSLDRIHRLFSLLDVGKHGAIGLRDGGDLGFFVRYPEPEVTGTVVGNTNISGEFVKLSKNGVTTGVYEAPSGYDQQMRTWAFRKFADGRYYIFVGLANDDYLARWRKDVNSACTGLGIVCFLTSVFGWLAYGSWMRHREGEERFRSVVSASPMGMHFYRLESDGRLVLTGANPVADSMLGVSHAGLTGKSIEEAFPDLKGTPVPEMYRNVATGASKAQKFETPYDDGHIRGIFEVTVYRTGDYTIAVDFLDISARKLAEEERIKLEKQMQHTQKLESLGVLAGGIAHDFNNILQVIIGNAEMARKSLPANTLSDKNLENIIQASSRAADLAKQMLAYSGKGKFVIEQLDLNRLVEEMLNMLEVSISKKAVLRVNPHHPLPTVEADATQIRQIIMNLVINASEAIGEKSGVIAITTGCMECDRSYLGSLWLKENIREGLYVYLEIADTGCGMDKETLARIFDPFFTTKFTGRGLGMAAVLGIVRGHHGTIEVCSEPDKGTAFKILLPASSIPIEMANGPTADNDWHGGGAILLVDDEETVRGIGSEMLRELGFTPLTANDGKDALEKYRGTPDIRLVILDLTMPHMDGEQCFTELKKLDPDVKVIMSSGYNQQEIAQKFADKKLAGFIQKPYRLAALKDEIRQAMIVP